MENTIIKSEQMSLILNDIARGLCHGCTIMEDSPLHQVLDQCYSLEMLYDLQQVATDMYNKNNSMPCGTWEYVSGIIPTLTHTTGGGRLKIEACQYDSGILATMSVNTTQGQSVLLIDLGSRTYYVCEPKMLKRYRLSILRDIGFEDVFDQVIQEYEVPEDPEPGSSEPEDFSDLVAEVLPEVTEVTEITE